MRERRDGEVWGVDAVGVRGRPPIKCKDRLLEYLRGIRDGEVWRVDALGVRRRPPIKCKDRVLEYLIERRY